MRISNITQYLGGARNVIAEEIVQGDQIEKTIDFGTDNLNDYTFEVETELFRANVTERGSNNITINTFQGVGTDGTSNATSTAVNYSYGSFEVNADSTSITHTAPSGQSNTPDIIGLASGNDSDGKIILTVPSSLVSNLRANTFAPADSTNPLIVTMGLRYETSGGTSRTLRFVWVIRYSPINSN